MWEGSSTLNPDMSNDVSKRSQIKSLTIVSLLAAAAFFFNSVMRECFGLLSMVFLDAM